MYTVERNCCMYVFRIYFSSISINKESRVRAFLLSVGKQKAKTKKVDLRRDRTCNLLIRSQAPCHWASRPRCYSTSTQLCYKSGRSSNANKNKHSFTEYPAKACRVGASKVTTGIHSVSGFFPPGSGAIVFTSTFTGSLAEFSIILITHRFTFLLSLPQSLPDALAQQS